MLTVAGFEPLCADRRADDRDAVRERLQELDPGAPAGPQRDDRDVGRRVARAYVPYRPRVLEVRRRRPVSDDDDPERRRRKRRQHPASAANQRTASRFGKKSRLPTNSNVNGPSRRSGRAAGSTTFNSTRPRAPRARSVELGADVDPVHAASASSSSGSYRAASSSIACAPAGSPFSRWSSASRRCV